MKVRHLKFSALILLLSMLPSCDDFLLKKTVSLIRVEGTLEFDPAIPGLTGDVSYSFQNKQQNDLTEIYLICHPSAKIEQVIYNKTQMRFEEGLGYGYGIYRIRIPRLKSEQTASMNIRFRLKGPINEDRMSLSKNEAFLDAKKIWMPIPFAELPNFHYEFTVITPTNYYAIFSGKLTKEKIAQNKRISTWKSEIDNALLSGNLFIGQFQRWVKNNIYIYSESPQNIPKILEYSLVCFNEFSRNTKFFPFTQFHIINKLYPYENMEEWIDAEFMANTIHISPEIFSRTNSISESETLRSIVPLIPPDSELKMLDVLSHEFAHTVTPGIVRFKENHHLELESYTEFLKTQFLSGRYPGLSSKLLERNRFILINLNIKNKSSHLTLWKYYYGVNCLSSAFENTRHLPYKFNNNVVEKYRLTRISWEELINTSEDLNRVVLSYSSNTNSVYYGMEDNLIGLEALKLYRYFQLYNIGLTSQPIQITNHYEKYHKWYHVENKIKVTVKNEFPVEVDGYFVHQVSTNYYTNYLKIKSASETNFILDNKTLQAFFQTRFSYLETSCDDNHLFFRNQDVSRLIISNINLFYVYNSYDFQHFTFNNEQAVFSPDNSWLNPFDDRAKSIAINTDISFRLDKTFENNSEIYILAYKDINNIPYSYVLIKVKKNRNKYEINSVMDPSSI